MSSDDVDVPRSGLEPVDPLAAHQRAQAAFAVVLAAVVPDQMILPTPCDEWTVADLVDHLIDGNQWVVELAGAEPPTLPFDRIEAHRLSTQAAHAVFAAPDGLTRIFSLGFADIPGAAFIGLRTSDAIAHAWDLAVAIGSPADLDPELATHALAVSRTMMTPGLRGPGRPFREEQPCAEDRPAADQLAAFLGRTVA